MSQSLLSPSLYTDEQSRRTNGELLPLYGVPWQDILNHTNNVASSASLDCYPLGCNLQRKASSALMHAAQFWPGSLWRAIAANLRCVPHDTLLEYIVTLVPAHSHNAAACSSQPADRVFDGESSRAIDAALHPFLQSNPKRLTVASHWPAPALATPLSCSRFPSPVATLVEHLQSILDSAALAPFSQGLSVHRKRFGHHLETCALSFLL